jgi:hypothetical protein
VVRPSRDPIVANKRRRKKAPPRAHPSNPLFLDIESIIHAAARFGQAAARR